MTQVRIFGREPALIIGFIGAVVAVLVGLNLPWLSAGAAVAVVGALTAIITAATTRPVGPSLYVGAVVAASALINEYGFHISDQVVSAVGGLTLAAFALFGIRPQVSPKQ